MTDSMNEERVPSLIPVLAVDDITQAIGFYSVLGFREVSSMPSENGELVHAHLSKGDSWLFLGLLGMTYYESHERTRLIKEGLAARGESVHEGESDSAAVAT